MPSLREYITSIVQNAFATVGLDPQLGLVEISQRPELGQFQCNGALPAAKALKQNPREVAQRVLDALAVQSIFADISLAGPGFINISVSDAFLANWINRLVDDPRLGVELVEHPQTVIMDYGGPNVAKTMHVGHLRSSIIGDSLQRVFRLMGDRVITDIHMGDWGLQMGQLITELERRRPDLPYFDSANTGAFSEESPVAIEDLEEMYPAASARTKVPEGADDATRSAAEQARDAARVATADLQSGRPGYYALWQHFVRVSHEALERDFGALGVHFDLWYGESDAHKWLAPMLDRLRQQGNIQESQGAQVIHLPPDESQKEVPPLIVVNRDGGVGYGSTDLATIEQRVHDFDPGSILYIVDARQSLHFEQLFRAARLTGVASRAQLEHLGFGTMNGPDGRPFKTREGGVLKLSDLLQEAGEQARQRMRENDVAQEYDEDEQNEIARLIAIATIKYADLMNHRTSNYIFDLEKFTRFEGRTGAYLLYMTVRCKSILRKAAERNLTPGAVQSPGDGERNLLLMLAALPDSIQQVYERRAPNYLCDYVFTLAQEFSRFYANCRILTEENADLRGGWLAIVDLTLRTFDLTLGLLGIESPERM